MINYLLTSNTLTFFDNDFNSHSIETGTMAFENALEALRNPNPDIEYLVGLASPAKSIADAFSSLPDTMILLPEGELTVTTSGVYYDGEPVHTTLTDRVLQIINEGLDVAAWVKFITNLYRNPFVAARDELYDFLEVAGLPITPDGHFLAFKKVHDDYTDCYTGTIDNSIGQTVQMNRGEVDDNRRNHCSTGLHFCSKNYLKSFGGARVMVVKINPADVVSIPDDYNYSKGRTWRYEVVGEIKQEVAEVYIWPAVWSEEDDDDGWGYDDSEYEDREDEDDDY